MSTLREFTYPSSDGRHAVRAYEWKPDGPVRGIVQIVHGVAEHMGRYDHVARFLNGHGFLVCGEDHLGHGKTGQGETRGFFAPKNGWDLVSRDVRRLQEIQGEKYPGIPYVMLGHSMGSFLTRTYLIRWPGTLDGAVLSGTGQESALLVAGGKALAGMIGAVKGPDYHSPLVHDLSLGSYNKAFRPNRTPVDWISSVEEEVDRYRRDPMCGFMPTVSMFRDMMEGLQLIARGSDLARMDPNLPIYVFSGDRDPVGAMGAGVNKVVGMLRGAGCADVTLKLYPGGRHEMFNESNKEEVLADLLAWLEEKIVK